MEHIGDAYYSAGLSKINAVHPRLRQISHTVSRKTRNTIIRDWKLDQCNDPDIQKQRFCVLEQHGTINMEWFHMQQTNMRVIDLGEAQQLILDQLHTFCYPRIEQPLSWSLMFLIQHKLLLDIKECSLYFLWRDDRSQEKRDNFKVLWFHFSISPKCSWQPKASNQHSHKLNVRMYFTGIKAVCPSYSRGKRTGKRKNK